VRLHLRPHPVRWRDRDPSAPVAGSAAPRTSRWRARLRSTLHKCSEDRIFGMAAEVGFWQLVSLPSLLLAVFGAVGYFGGVIGAAGIARIRADVLRLAGDVLSASTINSDVAPIVNDILSKGHAGLLSVSFVISLWSGSSAMADYVNTITVAYGMRGVRSAVRTRVFALGLYVAAVVAGIVLLPATVLGPDQIIDLAPRSAVPAVSRVVHDAYWPALVLVCVAAVTTLYVVSLPRRVSWRQQLPGAVVAVAIWLAGSALLRFYVAEKGQSDAFYGALAAPLAALLFFYIMALAIIFGGEVNAARRRNQEAAAEP